MTDPIADMLIRIKNAYLARKGVVVVPLSKMKLALSEVLKQEMYIDSYKVVEKKPQSDIEITLKYVGKRPALTGVTRVSKPGRRVYRGASEIERTLGGYGSTILSTSTGVLSDKQAKSKKVGGEVICKVW